MVLVIDDAVAVDAIAVIVMNVLSWHLSRFGLFVVDCDADTW